CVVRMRPNSRRRAARPRRRLYAAPSSPPAGGRKWHRPPAGSLRLLRAGLLARGGRNIHHTDMAILVVDDDQAVRAGLRRALSMPGYAVELARDGSEALTRLATDGSSIELLVLDVLMPGADGLEVTRRLRAEGNAIPILMLTARDQVSDRVAGLEAGADDYL